MMNKERAIAFKNLHVKGNPLILFNIWDSGSAKALQEAGAKAIATGSWSVAAAHGYEDRQKIPLELVDANTRRIVDSVDLPVTIDFEAGYGVSPAEVADSVRRIIDAGAVGINFEDQIIGGTGLYSIDDQCTRIRAIREVAGPEFFINARTDIFLKAEAASHAAHHLEEALQRAASYAAAGASGFFAPGLRNPDMIKRLCDLSLLPVNILQFPDMSSSPKQLAEFGVARISHGPYPYRQLVAALKEAARKALAMV
jgi:2-methylisocitrate lyase-like PEP mutase family enzyme